MDRTIYQKNLDRNARAAYDARVITKLVRNYRSHEMLIELPNRLFYEGDLVPCVDPALGNSCLKWAGLEAPFIPLLWHGIAGKDTQESRSPSWFNGDEATQVLDKKAKYTSRSPFVWLKILCRISIQP